MNLLVNYHREAFFFMGDFDNAMAFYIGRADAHVRNRTGN